MRVLFVTPYYPPLSYGGIETDVETLARIVARTGHATVLAPGREPEPVRETTRDGVVVLRTARLAPFSPYDWDAARYPELFRKVIADQGTTHVLAHNLHLWIQPRILEALLRASVEEGAALYLRSHNFCAPSEATVLRSTPWAGVCAVSSALARQTSALGVSPEIVHVVPAPVATDRFRPARHDEVRRRLEIAPDVPVVLHASRIVGGPDPLGIKGLPNLLRVLARLPTAHLVVATARPVPELEEAFRESRRKLGELARELGLAERLHVTSATAEEMPGIYNGCDVFAMLSRIETFGQAYAEASACGLPVVGTDVGGIYEVIEDGRTGYLVRSEDEAVEALQRLLSDPGLRERLGRAGRRRVLDRFSPPAVLTALQEALSTPHPSTAD